VNRKLIALSATGVLAFYGASAHAIQITLDEFTGDSAQMLVEILDAAPSGVTAEWSFTSDSAFTGDITGVWLGIVDALFDPSVIGASDVSVLTVLPDGVSYVVTIGSSIDLGSGVNLTGESGFALLFNFDLALKQQDAPPVNSIITNLLVGISTSGLTANVFDAAGARLMTTNGPEGSSKLAGGTVVQIPEPTSLSLLGAGLLIAGLFGRRRRT
jgi:hypothetical protein